MQLQDLNKTASGFKNTNPYPAWFIGHGNPMNVLMENAFTKSLASMDLVEYEKLGQAALLSIPTPDHYFPMIYSLGLVTQKDEIRFTFEEVQNACVSMRCFEIGSQ